MSTHDEAEVRAAAEHYVQVRGRIDRGEADWSEMIALFTDDAVFVDPAWGRAEGKAASSSSSTPPCPAWTSTSRSTSGR